MNKFKTTTMCIALASVLMASGCISTADTYEVAKEVNNDTFKASMKRFCGYTASLAANRLLTDGEIVKRNEFCSLYRARIIEPHSL